MILWFVSLNYGFDFWVVVVRLLTPRVLVSNIFTMCLKMAASIANNAAVYKKFRYVAPELPNNLIDQNDFVVDLPNYKLINIGLDLARFQRRYSYYNITLSQYFFRQIYFMMGHILLFILSTPNCKQTHYIELRCWK